MLLNGFILGFSIAAPIGPMGLLCIRHTLEQGRLMGLLAGLGVATADAVYGCIAGFGLTAISNFLIGLQGWLRLIGGSYLCYLGITIFLAHPHLQMANHLPIQKILEAYFSTFLFTLSNPVTILSFAAIFAGLGIGTTTVDYQAGSQLVIGVFLGSATWWLILSSVVGELRAHFNATVLTWINRFSGVVIAAFGLLALVSLLS